MKSTTKNNTRFFLLVISITVICLLEHIVSYYIHILIKNKTDLEAFELVISDGSLFYFSVIRSITALIECYTSEVFVNSSLRRVILAIPFLSLWALIVHIIYFISSKDIDFFYNSIQIISLLISATPCVVIYWRMHSISSINLNH